MYCDALTAVIHQVSLSVEYLCWALDDYLFFPMICVDAEEFTGERVGPFWPDPNATGFIIELVELNFGEFMLSRVEPVRCVDVGVASA